MKKVLFILFLVLSSTCFSQTIVTRATGANTVADTRHQATKNLYEPRYQDTTQANIAGANMQTNNIGVDSCGAKIYTRNPQAEWIRFCNPKRWVRTGVDNSSSVTNISVLNDSTIIICLGNGVCDTLHINTNIINISNVSFLNDSTIVVCGLDTTVVPPVLKCDTVHIPKQPIATLYQNGTNLTATNIVEFGSNPGIPLSNLQHNTALETGYFVQTFRGQPVFEPPYQFFQNQYFPSGTAIASFKNHGDYFTHSTTPHAITDRLVINYTGAAYLWSPYTKGYLGDSVNAYMINTNGRGFGSFGWYQDDTTAKTTGIAFHTQDTNIVAGVTIFAAPRLHSTGNNIMGGNLSDYLVADFNTNKDMKFYGYPSSRNNGQTPKVLFTDATGNVKLGTVGAGSTITIINNTKIQVCNVTCDTFTVTGPAQLVFVLNDSTLRVCDTIFSHCDTVHIPQTFFDQRFFTPNQVSFANTTHLTSGFNLYVGRNGSTSPTGTSDNFNFGNGNVIVANTTEAFVANHNNNVGGNENVVLGRNMNVRGNTNFSAGTDGTIKSTANYSATFNDANDNWGTSSLTSGFGNDNYVENGFTGGNDNVNGYTSTDGLGTANTYSSSFMYGVSNLSVGSRNFVGGSFLFANNTSGDVILFGKGVTATTTKSFNVGWIGTTPNFTIIDSATKWNNNRIEPDTAQIAAANNLTLGVGNVMLISGNTQINAITTQNWQAGSSPVYLVFSGTPTVKHNTAGGAGTATILLAGAVDFVAAAGDILTLLYDGTNWRETARKLASSGIVSITADNGLSMSTPSNVQLGSSSAPGSALLHNTYINATASFSLILNGSSSVLLDAENSGSGNALSAGSVTGIALSAVSGGAANPTVAMTNSGGGQAFTADGVVDNVVVGIVRNNNTATTNTIIPILQIARGTVNTAADGEGGSIDFKLETSTNVDAISNQLISKWVTAANATRTSQLDITGVNSASTNTIMSAHGSGVVGIGISSAYTSSRLNVVDNSVAAKMVDMTSTSTAAVSNTQKILNISLSGANSNSSVQTFGISVSNTHTGSGASLANYGIYSTASGVTTGTGQSGANANFAIFGEATDGVGINGLCTTGVAVFGQASSTGTAIYGYGGSIGVKSTNATLGALIQIVPAGTNDVAEILRLQRETSGTAANNIGEAIHWYLERDDGGFSLAAESIVKWSNVVAGSRTSQMEFATINNGGSITSRLGITGPGSILTAMNGAIATNATDGFLYIPTCAGPPTGTPTVQTGMAPMVFDSTNNKLYVYGGGVWNVMN